MEVTLSRANMDDVEELHAMQVRAFKELLEKYWDFDTNPGNESVEKVGARLQQDFTFFYFICIGQQKVGAVRVVDQKESGKKGFLQSLYCRNFKARALHRKQSGYVKKRMEVRIGSWTRFCRSPGTAIYMRKWGTGGQAERKLLMKGLHWYFMKKRRQTGYECHHTWLRRLRQHTEGML